MLGVDLVTVLHSTRRVNGTWARSLGGHNHPEADIRQSNSSKTPNVADETRAKQQLFALRSGVVPAVPLEALASW